MVKTLSCGFSCRRPPVGFFCPSAPEPPPDDPFPVVLLSCCSPPPPVEAFFRPFDEETAPVPIGGVVEAEPGEPRCETGEAEVDLGSCRCVLLKVLLLLLLLLSEPNVRTEVARFPDRRVGRGRMELLLLVMMKVVMVRMMLARLLLLLLMLLLLLLLLQCVLGSERIRHDVGGARGCIAGTGATSVAAGTLLVASERPQRQLTRCTTVTHHHRRGTGTSHRLTAQFERVDRPFQQVGPRCAPNTLAQPEGGSLDARRFRVVNLRDEIRRAMVDVVRGQLIERVMMRVGVVRVVVMWVIHRRDLATVPFELQLHMHRMKVVPAHELAATFTLMTQVF
uniref:Uncharacterized protein n=1 Tax=Anopheles atroparvus TaxID=41427 RepID=A0A182IV76_ANOAO